MELFLSVLVTFSLFFLDISFCTNTSTSQNTDFVNTEQRLRDDILGNYSYRIRPNATSEVFVSLVLLSLNDLNIESQEMSVMAIIHAYWYDERLKWTASDYGDLTGIDVKVKEVWTPSMLVHNSVKSIKLLGDSTIPFRVSYDGRVLWTPTVLLDTSCEMKVFYFPFEKQQCPIVLYPYGYLSTEVRLRPQDEANPVNLFYYGKNAEWQFKGANQANATLKEDDAEYLAITYTLNFKRRWLYQSLSLIMPAILNLILMLGVFTLNIESGEKMGYSLTVFLSYIVLLTLVGDALPQVSTEISLLQIYLTCVLVVGCLSTLAAIWIINVYNRDDETDPMPKSTKKLIKWVVLPLTSIVFWRYVHWRFKRLENKIHDDENASRNADNSNGARNTDGQSLNPPQTTDISDNHGSFKQMQIFDQSEKCKNPQRKNSIIQPNSGLISSKKSRTDQRSSTLFHNAYFDSSSTSSDCGLLPQKDKELLADGNLSITPPPTISTPCWPGHKHELDQRLDLMTWRDMARLMDAFFLRFLGGLLLVFTSVVLVILFLAP